MAGGFESRSIFAKLPAQGRSHQDLQGCTLRDIAARLVGEVGIGPMAKVLITGATGFIGRNLLWRLAADDHDLHAIVRKESGWQLRNDPTCRCTLHPCDITDGSAVQKVFDNARPDIIYHLAAYGVQADKRDRQQMLSTCVLGTANLLEAARNTDYQRFVVAGSAWECADGREIIHENDFFAPLTTYGIAKAASSMLALEEARSGRPISLVRIFSAYGPGEAPQRLTQYIINCCIRGETPKVSSGIQVRDHVYIDDVVELIIAAAEPDLPDGAILHAATGKGTAVRKVIETILDVAGRPVAAQFGSVTLRSGEPLRCIASIEKTKELTGWRPHYSLRDGLNETWRRRRPEVLSAA